ncbi:MAG: rhodanese family protein [Afipia sp.]|nr:rhodanese family protein [Afipia sp.]
MTIPTITAKQAAQMLAEGATLVDIREPNERARERIDSAIHWPLSALTDAAPLNSGRIIFHCKSGARTAANAQRLKARAGDSCDVYLVEGGLDELRRAGLPITVDRSQPIELQRQVQIVAGSMGFLGTALGFLVSPIFYIVPAFVGAGLLFAGVTGFCGMARILMHAPWNRVAINAN